MICVARHEPHPVSSLSSRRIESYSFRVVITVDRPIVGKAPAQLSYRVLKACPTGNDHTKRASAVRVQTLKVFEVSVEKGILIVPFDLQGDRAGSERLYV